MNKKANWTLPAIFGIAGIAMLLDAIWIKALLPASRIFEGFLALVFIILAIVTHFASR